MRNSQQIVVSPFPTANHSKAAVCHFRVTKKRRIATTLLSCSEGDGQIDESAIIRYSLKRCHQVNSSLS